MFTHFLRFSRLIILTSYIVLLVLHHPAAASPGGGSGDGGIKANQLMAGLPLYFEANRGQISEKFDYLARAGNLRAYHRLRRGGYVAEGSGQTRSFRGW